MFTLIFFAIVIYVVISKLGKASQARPRNEFDVFLTLLSQQIQAYNSMPAAQRQAQAAQVALLMGQMNSRMRDIDNIHRGMYEARVGEITGMAAQAGIDVTPPSWG
jgi:hypothetical protein